MGKKKNNEKKTDATDGLMTWYREYEPEKRKPSKGYTRCKRPKKQNGTKDSRNNKKEAHTDAEGDQPVKK